MDSKPRLHPYVPEAQDLLRRGRISRREFLRLATLLGTSYAAAQVLAACAAPTATAPAATSAPVSAIKRGGTMRSAMSIAKLEHPARYSWVFDSNVTRHITEYLTVTDEKNITHPLLLEKWEASEDLLTWTLTLKSGIKFNNGDALTTDDVIFTMNEWLNPEVGSSILGLMSYLKPENIEKVDDLVLTLHLDSPQIAVPEHLFHYPAQILHHSFEGDISKNPIGTGPYTLADYTEGERAVLKRREDYWQMGEDGQPLPYLDEIRYVGLGEDQTAAIAAIQSGQVDNIYDPRITTWQALKEEPSVKVTPVATAQTRCLRFRVDLEPWTDNRVRQAFRAILNRQKILDTAYFGEAQIGQDVHVAQVHPEYAPIDTPPYDPDKAKALLAEAGHPDGLDVTLTSSDEWTDVGTMSQVIKQDAEPGGFRVTINNVPQSTYWDQWTQVDLGITPWTHRPLGTMVLSLAYIADETGTPVPWNESRWVDEEFSTLLREAEGTLDVEARRAVMAKLEAIQQERGSIGITYWQNVWDITNRKFQGIKGHPTDYHLWNEVWYDPEA
jgi:peptide/nickel transport system substrate-binding protein